MKGQPETLELSACDGVRLSFTVRRAPSDRPVWAFIHSLGMEASFWDAVAERIHPACTVIALDARGHGRSDLGSATLTCALMARDLCEVLDHLGIARVLVGGASMGGCVALEFAAGYPQKTAGAALIDTTAWYGPNAPADWEARAEKASSEGLQALIGFQVTRWFSDSFRSREPEQVKHWTSVFLKNRLEGYMASCRMLGAFDGRPLLEQVAVPTWIVVGEEDYAAPVAMAQALHDGIAGSTLQVIAGARHLTPLEVPDQIADGLLALCKGGAR